MLHAQDLESLPQLREPVLTVYLDTNPANPRNQARKGPATWLRSQARKLVQRWGANEREACLEQAQRVSAYVLDRRDGGSRALVAFAGPEAWRLLPLQVAVDEEIYWGAPALGQLLWLLDEHQPCGVVVVNRAGARFFRFHMGEIEEDPARPMLLDTSQWRKTTLVMGVGGEQDRFARRAEANYQRFYEQIAAECQRWSERERLEPLLLLGGGKAVEAVRTALPEAFAERVLSADLEPAGDTPSAIIARAEPLMEAWKRERERRDVARLLEHRTSTEVITGVEETLAALQRGRARKLITVRGLRGRLRQCPACGWVSGEERRCPECGTPRPLASPRAVLPALARARGVGVEVVAGPAAAVLEVQAGGLAAWLQAA